MLVGRWRAIKTWRGVDVRKPVKEPCHVVSSGYLRGISCVVGDRGKKHFIGRIYQCWQSLGCGGQDTLQIHTCKLEC